MLISVASLTHTLARDSVTFTTGKVVTLNNYLLQCENVPEKVKELARQWQKKHCGGESEDEEGQVVPITHQAQKHSQEAPSATTSASKKQKKFTVLAVKAIAFGLPQQLTFEDKLLQAFVSAGISFNAINDPELRALFHDYVPGAKLPTRQSLSGQVLDRQVAKLQGTITSDLKGAYATVQCDRWKDISKKHFVAFMFTARHEVIS
jgi:hypothetical protein